VGARALLAHSLTAALLLAAVPASAAARGCTGGTVYINKGFDDVRLGQTRAQLIGELGKPYFENANGFMQFAPGDGVPECDVYRTSGAKTSTAGTIALAGRGFVVSGGIRIFDAGGLRQLKKRYPRMRLIRPSDDQPYYRIRGHYKGRKVFTSLIPSKPSLDARVLQVFIGFV
jgi:hypothetical protein